MKTAYCFLSTNHHTIAAAVRMITAAREQAPTPPEWRTAGELSAEPAPERMIVASAYHIAPPIGGWVVVYPNVPGFVPFASALSRQARKLTVGVTPIQAVGWQGGHPVAVPDALPELLDARYFRDLLIPPVADWAAWIHLWTPQWTPPKEASDDH